MVQFSANTKIHFSSTLQIILSTALKPNPSQTNHL